MDEKINKRIKKLRESKKTKEITKTILHIAAAGGLAMIIGGTSRDSKKMPAMVKELAKYSKSRVRECLKRLSMQNYIKYDRNDLTSPIFLSEKGLKRHSTQALKDKILTCTMKKWDHIWRLVTFDVKETERYKRDGFRKKLSSMDFYKLQKNIYITPFAVEKEIEDLIKSYRMWNNAHIFHVADLGREEERVKTFFLDNA